MKMVMLSICGVVAFSFAFLHLLLLVGASLGEFVLGGKYRVIPKEKRWVNAILIFIFSVIGVSYFYAALAARFSIIILVILGGYTIFLLYAVYEKIFLTKSKKETLLLAPLSAISLITSVMGLCAYFFNL